MVGIGLLSVGLRAATTAARFVLLLAMARFLGPADLGIYGVMAACVAIALYPLGMDFYTFNTRELLARETDEHPILIRDQLAAHGAAYVIVLPLLLGVFMAGLLPFQYVAWFYALLMLEHLGQEANRLFTTLSRPIVANVVTFFRGGAWSYAAALLLFASEGTRRLDTIWICWSIGGLLSLLVTAWYLRHLPWHRTLERPIDWAWIRGGVQVASRFLVASIALSTLEYLSRFFIQHFHGKAMVGVYTFYANLSMVVQTFVATGIMLILYPKTISAFQQGDMAEYGALMRRMTLSSTGFAAGLALVMALGIYPVLMLVGKPLYGQYLPTYWTLLVAIVVFVVAQMPRHALYVRRADGSILVGTLVAFAVGTLLNALLVPRFGILGGGLATLGSSTALAVTMLVLLRLVTSRAANPPLGEPSVAAR